MLLATKLGNPTEWAINSADLIILPALRTYSLVLIHFILTLFGISSISHSGIRHSPPQVLAHKHHWTTKLLLHF